jgi:SAM-dependent methyltransferase
LNEDSPKPPADPEALINAFLGVPTRDLNRWARLWAEDLEFPVGSHRRGFFGRAITLLKRLFRPLVRTAGSDLWERQRVFNLILLETLEQRTAEHQQAIEAHARLLEQHDRRIAEGMADVMSHNDALFARVDQKLDRYRQESRELWHRLGAFIAAGEEEPPRSLHPLREVQKEQSYLAFEARQRGSEEEIAQRVAAYLPYLEGKGTVLDLGCGRGEALEIFGSHGLEARGVDSSAEMVAHCQEKGLRAEAGDLFKYLQAVEEGTLGAIVSFHVIEHLPAPALDRLVRLAWLALAPGGVLIFETPSPLSLVMAARNFWIDPTHLRPVHPASLELTYREAGFEPVHRLDLHPFPKDEHLPEIDLALLPEEQRALADHVNRMRDLLDDLLFGARDFAMVGVKP